MLPRPLLTLILAAIAAPGCKKTETYAGTACVSVAADVTACADAADVSATDLFVPWTCDDEVVDSISGAGTITDVGYDTGADTDAAMTDPACCYTAVLHDSSPGSDCVIGRPFCVDGAPLLAAAVEAGEGARAAAWTRAGLGEHASVAAFAKLALELMAHGAPLELLADVFAAGRDEVAHADLCFTLAARFGGAAPSAGPYPFPGPVDVTRSLAAIAADAVREGCVGETLGAVLARDAAAAVEDPQVRAVFEALATDEERHAVLSWRIVAWALKVGGADVRAAVIAAFREPAPAVDRASLALRAGIAPEAFAIGAALDAVVRPAAARLLAA